jgi:hypothetical protein
MDNNDNDNIQSWDKSHNMALLFNLVSSQIRNDGVYSDFSRKQTINSF